MVGERNNDKFNHHKDKHAQHLARLVKETTHGLTIDVMKLE